MDDAGGHREGRDTGRTDHGIDFPALRQEQVQELGHQNTARRVEDEGNKAEAHDEQRLRLQELRRVHVERDGDAEKDRDKVRQHLLRRLGQRVQHATLANQVAEHQEADKRNGLRGKDARDDRDDDGEEDARCFGDLLRLIRHADEPLLLRCQQADDGRLDDGYQRHIGIGSDGDRADVAALQGVCHDNGCWAVRRADDGDGGGVADVKAAEARNEKCEKYAKLRRRAEDHQLGVRQQRTEIDHCTDADKQYEREQLICNALFIQKMQDLEVRARQIHQDRAEADRQQQRGLHILGDGEIDEHRADEPHDDELPAVSLQQGLRIFQQNFQIRCLPLAV